LDLESRYKRQSELFIPFLLERSYEVLNVDRLALKTAGCTDEEIKSICQSASREEAVHGIRFIRGRLLEEIHQKQKALDGLDYLLYKIKKQENLS
jgi:hypothetical protein